ncbi:MAG: hypothetical protein COB24_05825 [Hyphomicrobiales bacterium]|nr:MAG: hypothetical protein COB24_05825 [Hyphomicrobiales bacterium]
MNSKIKVAVEWLARTLALLGGFVLISMIIITCVSIFGRTLINIGLGPIPGDFELIEALAAFVVFAFLPWCQITRGHAAVDIFTAFLPDNFNRWIDLIAEILMGLAIFIIAWKLWDGTISKTKYGETTFILQFPIWWAYALSLSVALLGCLVAFYMIILRIIEVIYGKTEINSNSGAVH